MPDRMARCRRRFASALVASMTAAAPVAGAATLPAFTEAGPYGDPLLLAPAPIRSNATLLGPIRFVDRPASGRPIPTRVDPTKVFPRFSNSPTAATTGGDDDGDEDEDPRPSRPGTLPRSFVRTPDPSPSLRNRSLGPHLVPDAEFPLNERASLGVIGQAGRLDGRISQSVTVPIAARATPPSGPKIGPAAGPKTRELGLGLSLEYRFGQ